MTLVAGQVGIRMGRGAGAGRTLCRGLGAAAFAVLAASAGARAQGAAPVQPRPGPTAAALDSLRAENARLAAKMDSVQQELREHRYPENFVSTALEEQAGRFGLLVGIAVTVVGAISFAGLRWEVHRMKKEVQDMINVQKSESVALEDRLKKEVQDMTSVQKRENDALEARLVGEVRRTERKVQAALNEALAAQKRALAETLDAQKSALGETLEEHRRDAAGTEARVAGMEARLAGNEALIRRAAGNAYVAIASLYRKSSPGVAVAASLLAAGNFYTAQDAPSRKLGAMKLAHALALLKGIPPEERQQVAVQLVSAVGLRDEAFNLLHQYGDRAMDDVVAEVRTSIQALLPRPAQPSAAGAAAD